MERTSQAVELSGPTLEGLARVLEITDSETSEKLGKKVESALQDYATHLRSTASSPKKIHDKFERMSTQHLHLLKAFRELDQSLADDDDVFFPAYVRGVLSRHVTPKRRRSRGT